MKKYKLLSVLILGIFLFGAVAGTASALTVTFEFKDINEAKWAMKHIFKMRAENIVSGYKDGSFKPNKPVTHAEAVVLTMKAVGLVDEEQQTVTDAVYLPYKDAHIIPFWAKEAVSVASEQGFLEPGSSGNFQPNKAASREWVVKLIVKSLGLSEDAESKSNTVLPFKDIEAIPEESIGYIAVALENNIISGFPDGTFKPNKPVTRAEISVMLGTSTDTIPIPGEIRNKIEGTVIGVSLFSDSEDDDKTVTENVYSDPDKDIQGTITLRTEDDEEETYKVAENALIYIDDSAAALKDIVVGSKAEAVLNADEVVVYVEVKPLTVRGIVQSVDAENQKIYITNKYMKFRKNNNNTDDTDSIKEFGVSSDAAITLNGEPAELAEIMAGAQVIMTLDGDKEVIAIKAIKLKTIEKDLIKKKEEALREANKKKEETLREVNKKKEEALREFHKKGNRR